MSAAVASANLNPRPNGSSAAESGPWSQFRASSPGGLSSRGGPADRARPRLLPAVRGGRADPTRRARTWARRGVRRARRGIGRARRGKGPRLLFVPQQDPLRTGGGALARRGARAGKGGEGDDGRSNQPKHQRTNQSIIRQATHHPSTDRGRGAPACAPSPPRAPRAPRLARSAAPRPPPRRAPGRRGRR